MVSDSTEGTKATSILGRVDGPFDQCNIRSASNQCLLFRSEDQQDAQGQSGCNGSWHDSITTIPASHRRLDTIGRHLRPKTSSGGCGKDMFVSSTSSRGHSPCTISREFNYLSSIATTFFSTSLAPRTPSIVSQYIPFIRIIIGQF